MPGVHNACFDTIFGFNEGFMSSSACREVRTSSSTPHSTLLMMCQNGVFSTADSAHTSVRHASLSLRGMFLILIILAHTRRRSCRCRMRYTLPKEPTPKTLSRSYCSISVLSAWCICWLWLRWGTFSLCLRKEPSEMLPSRSDVYYPKRLPTDICMS